MTSESPPTDAPATPTTAITPEVVDPAATDGVDETDRESAGESIDRPAKVMRLGTMVRHLLEELRSDGLDEPSRDHLRRIHRTVVEELGDALSPELSEELGRLAVDLEGDATPSPDELRIAHAQLVGWLEGLVQGMQAMLVAQQMAAQNQLASMRAQLPAGDDERPGTYL
ncbi:MAG: DUF2587 domain-containing protein [Actinomyces sp.]|nr:MAG: DUF2587 domain-containing protein [Actinomyces sp.]